MFQSKVALRGQLKIKKIETNKAPLSWRLSNWIRSAFVLGWLQYHLAYLLSRLFGVLTVRSRLLVRVKTKAGQWIDYGVVGYRVVTTVGVNYIVDAFQNSVELENMKYHACGTGSTAEAVGDTALVTECTTALNPDSTRGVGTTTEGASANIYRTVATLTFDASAAVVEHGIFSAASSGVLLDRTVFSAVNVGSGDSIQFTYELTFNAGS